MESKPLTYLALAVALLLFGCYFARWARNDPRPADYSAFWAAGILYREGRPAYDLESQCREKARFGGSQCMAFNHPPVLLPVMALTASDDYFASYRRWSAFLWALVLVCLLPLYGLTGDLLKSITLLCFYPAYLSVMQGQDTALVLLGVLLWAHFLVKGEDRWAGLSLALACVKPHFAVALAVPLVFSRPRAFLWFCAGASALVLWSLLLVGPEGLAGLVRLLVLTAEGNGYGINKHHMVNLTGLLARAGLNPFLAWPAFALAIAATSLLWRYKGTGLTELCLGVVAAVFTAPHLHLHDAALLLLPLALTPAWVTALTALALFMLPDYRHNIVYTLMAGAALFHMWRLWSGRVVVESPA